MCVCIDLQFDAGDVEIIAAQENMKKVMKEKQLEFARQIGAGAQQKDPGVHWHA